MTEYGFCECGCGQKTNPIQATNQRLGYKKGKPHRFVLGHHLRINTYSSPLYRRCVKTEDGSIEQEHVVIVIRALGHRLPPRAQVHHLDGNRRNNAPSNLVACPNRAYHALLHQRQRALEISGHADWRKCTFCKTYDDPTNLKMSRRSRVFHLACETAYQRDRRHAKRTA